MGENSKIEWTDHTFNPWWGCTKVSPGCDHCYALRESVRHGEKNLWGVDAHRRLFGLKHWNLPLKWERQARKDGKRARVFCASMADVFDNHPQVTGAREMLWDLIRKTPRLDWLILTKRIGNTVHMLPEDWGGGYPNVWLGISVVNQVEADRDIPKLIHTPAKVRFLSVEPMLGRVDLEASMARSFHDDFDRSDFRDHLHWVICGGESGAGARPLELCWATYLAGWCERRRVAFFMKQGSQANWPKFKDFSTFPTDLQRREWPEVTHV